MLGHLPSIPLPHTGSREVLFREDGTVAGSAHDAGALVREKDLPGTADRMRKHFWAKFQKLLNAVQKRNNKTYFTYC